jgi:DNA-binding CsgD family transcriptional regulator
MRLSLPTGNGVSRHNTIFLVILALALYWGAICSFKFNIFIETKGMPDELLKADITSVVGSLGLFLTLFFAGVFPKLLINRKSRYAIRALPFLLCTVSGVLAAMQQSGAIVPYSALLIGRFFSNLGLGFALIQIIPCIARSSPRDASLIVVISFFCGVLISLCLSNLHVLVSIMATVFLVWACAASAALLPYEAIMTKTFNIDEGASITEKNPDEFLQASDPPSLPHLKRMPEKGFWAQSCGMVFASILYSIAIPLIPLIGLEQGFNLSVSIILLFSGTVMLIFILATGRTVNFRLTQWSLFIPMIISLLSLLVFDRIWALLFYALLAITFTFYDLINFIILSDFSRGRDWYSVVRIYCLGRAASVFGMVLGRLLIMPISNGGIAYDETRIGYLIYVVTAVMIVAVAFLAKSAVYGNRLRKEREVAEKGRWMRACEVVSEKYGLSAREHDVLILLSRGRNADFIAQTHYISVSTAKTHIYRIYHKLSIHSQQDLVSLIEKKARATTNEHDEQDERPTKAVL